jgi:hypothetical protein
MPQAHGLQSVGLPEKHSCLISPDENDYNINISNEHIGTMNLVRITKVDR